MKKIKSFLTSNTLISALVGAILTGCVSWFLLNKQIHDANNEAIRKDRVLIIKDAEYLFSQAPLVEATFLQAAIQSSVAENGGLLCFKMALNGEESDKCDFSQVANMAYVSAKDAFTFNAQYKSLTRLIPIYFCGQSKYNLSQLKLHDGEWWSKKYSSLREDLLSSMYEEMYKEIKCKK